MSSSLNRPTVSSIWSKSISPICAKASSVARMISMYFMVGLPCVVGPRSNPFTHRSNEEPADRQPAGLFFRSIATRHRNRAVLFELPGQWHNPPSEQGNRSVAYEGVIGDQFAGSGVGPSRPEGSTMTTQPAAQAPRTGAHAAPEEGQPVKQAVAGGASIAAAALLLTAGFITLFQGISAVAEDEVFVSGPQYVYELDLSSWGWVHIVFGILLILTSL